MLYVKVNKIAQTVKPILVLHFSSTGINRPVIIMHAPRQDSMPKYISAPAIFIFGIMTAVTSVTINPVPSTMQPRFAALRDSLVQMPEMIMNIAQNTG